MLHFVRLMMHFLELPKHKGSVMGAIQFQPFPVLITDRLFLRRLVLTDADGIFALRSDLDVIK